MSLNKLLNNHLFASNLMSEVVSNDNLDEALALVYKSRKDDSHNSDIWDLSLYWLKHKEHIRTKLLSGQYALSPVDVFIGKDGKYYTRWCAKDAVVLKALSMIISNIVGVEVGHACYHLKGHGGLKEAVRNAGIQLANFNYAIKSDVANFYESMDHEILLEHCKEIIKDARIIAIIHQYMNRVEVLSGEFHLISRGISKGCPLSPLMGALILKSLDKIIRSGCVYIRYMDDWLILTKTRGQLRSLVKEMHRVMQKLKFKLAIDKTYIGRIWNGFDFLGYRFSKQGIVGLAAKTISNFLEKTAKLYEQGASNLRISCYVNRWTGWVEGGLNGYA